MSQLNLRRLEYFLAVAEHGTVTAAAEQLRIAQPALSRQLRTLERELRLPLFEHQGNRLALTQAGRSFVTVARRLQVEVRGVEQAAAALRTGRVDRLVIAATSTSVAGFIAAFIATTTAEDPLLLTQETHHFEIPDALLSGADFAVSPTAPSPGLVTRELEPVAIQAYVHPEHPWAIAGRTEVTLTELCAQSAILPTQDSVSRRLLDDALIAEQLAFTEVAECDDGQTIQALAVTGRGVGVTTSRPMFGVHPLRIVTEQMPTGLQLPLHAAWLPGHFAADVISDLADRLSRFMQSTDRGL